MASNSRRFLVAAGLTLAFAAAVHGQELVVKNTNIVLPAMLEDSVMTNGFVVSNASDQPVEITGVRPTCGCTFARAETNIVQPHQLVRILFGYHASRVPGSVSKKILLSTASGQVYLGFTANVKPIFELSDSSVNLGTIDRTNTKILVREITVSAAESCTNVTADSMTYNAANLKVDWSWQKKDRVVRFKIEIDTTKYTDSILRDGFSVNLVCGANSRQYYFPIVGQFR